MSDCEEVLAILKRIEQNQLKTLQIQTEELNQSKARFERADAQVQESIQIQTEQLNLSKAQIERADAQVQESIKLQKTAVYWQKKALIVVVPFILLVMLYVLNLLF